MSVANPVIAAPPARSRARRWIGRALRWTAAGVGVLLVGTTVAGRVLHARDEARWRPPGRLVDVGGRQLHLYCTGTGSPTVVLEAGLGEFSLPAWHSVQPQIAACTRVCSYDRAGQGWSDPAPEPQLATAMVDDLHALLAGAGERAPFVMVGHSAGGPLVRHYATHHPEQVVGMVLLDGSHENQKKLEPIPAWVGWMVRALPVVNALGVDRVAASFGAADTITAIAAARTTRAATVASLVDFWSVFDPWLAQVGADARPFGDLPLVVITAGKRSTAPGETPEESARSKERWYAMQKDIVSRSTAGRWILVDSSGHHIQHDQPALVVATVRAQVDAARVVDATPMAPPASAVP